jgi:hypothetical protein
MVSSRSCFDPHWNSLRVAFREERFLNRLNYLETENSTLSSLLKGSQGCIPRRTFSKQAELFGNWEQYISSLQGCITRTSSKQAELFGNWEQYIIQLTETVSRLHSEKNFFQRGWIIWKLRTVHYPAHWKSLKVAFLEEGFLNRLNCLELENSTLSSLLKGSQGCIQRRTFSKQAELFGNWEQYISSLQGCIPRRTSSKQAELFGNWDQYIIQLTERVSGLHSEKNVFQPGWTIWKLRTAYYPDIFIFV